MAKQRTITSNLGLYVYGEAAISLGLLGLVSGDFATTWQNVGPNIPLRVPLAYLTAVIAPAGGIAPLLPRTARAGALTLTIVYSVFTLIWVPKAFVNLGNYDPIGNVFEEFSLVAAGFVLCAIFSPAGSSIVRRRPFFALLFGICPISFGIVHIIDMPGLLGDPGLAAADQNVLGLCHHHGLFRGRRSHPHRHHGAACRAPPHRGDRDLRVAGLDPESVRWAKQSLQLGRQRDLHRFGRRQLGRLRLHQRSGKNQTNPSRIPRRSKHPRLNLSLVPNPGSIEAAPSRYLFVADRFRGAVATASTPRRLGT